jgi:hypothetical protein
MIVSSVNLRKIDSADFSYPGCTDIVLTSNTKDPIGIQGVGRPWVVPRFESIINSIAGLPTKQDLVAENFLGKPPTSSTPPNTILNNIMVDDLLPTYQTSPVLHSGKQMGQIFKYIYLMPNIQIISNIQMFLTSNLQIF